VGQRRRQIAAPERRRRGAPVGVQDFGGIADDLPGRGGEIAGHQGSPDAVGIAQHAVALIAEAVRHAVPLQRGNDRLAQVAQVRRFHLLTKELDHDDGEVTATMKVRRASVYKTYAQEIEALYR
jgi:hypothetical protein